MNKVCDHKSVGILVRKNSKVLLIERGKYPWGFALPAGHVDQDKFFKDAAKRELWEEVGLRANDFKFLIEGQKENPCRRGGGNWHYWKIYEADVKGNIQRSQKETKQTRWLTRKQIQKLANKTDQYLKGKISESEWQKSPGLEPVWKEWLTELHII